MKSQYFANKLLNDNRDDMYLAFFTGNPTQDGVEIVQTARPQITSASANDGYLSNTAEIVFKASAANGQAKLANHWGIFDAATAGNLLYFFPISFDLVCDIDAEIKVGVGSLILKEV